MHTTILVTGATGTVGKETVIQLSLANNARVRAGVHSIIKGENLKRLPGVEVVEMDFKDPESLHAAFTHADKLFLITPFAAEQFEMARTLVDEAKNAGVKHIVKLSVLGAEEEPGIHLGRWHREIEEYIEQSGIPYTFLRPGPFMQNYANFETENIQSEGRFYQPTGNGKVSCIDVRDIAAVAVEVLTGPGHEGKAYNLTGPEALSNQEVAEIFSEVTGKKVEFVDVPESAAKDAMVQHHMPEWMADAMLELQRMCKENRYSATTDTVQKLTGRPPHTFRKFAEDYKECFMQGEKQ
ncbi:SDR family oxidoreductase [Pontibacter sp. E15-1]|uniref:SDR family oxidoreductase n=1 Tax=Pontibacter sp. E15-1 TaxID=2919918 RepID=UPI001F4FAAE7|nr:SDR family oxidoreductase [Pontibacter sp. E15-1]MCJ8164000.1 SDR family oxidoreductase [Pontibacter sp. E15-1]